MKVKENKFEKFNKQTTINKELLANVKGGKPGPGYRETISGDCNGSGRSCWAAVKDILESIGFGF